MRPVQAPVDTLRVKETQSLAAVKTQSFNHVVPKTPFKGILALSSQDHGPMVEIRCSFSFLHLFQPKRGTNSKHDEPSTIPLPIPRLPRNEPCLSNCLALRANGSVCPGSHENMTLGQKCSSRETGGRVWGCWNPMKTAKHPTHNNLSRS